ncbi:uncharacterized protein LOC144055425 [Vanacampus margaritifer]
MLAAGECARRFSPLLTHARTHTRADKRPARCEEHKCFGGRRLWSSISRQDESRRDEKKQKVLRPDEDRPQPRPNQLRRLASYVFSSSTLETEHYPHGGGAAFIQRSRSAESSPAHAAAAAGWRRRHGGVAAAGGGGALPARARHSVLNVSRSQLQHMLAKLISKNSS